jgi:ribose 5-phosphate isomerase B
MIAMRVYLGSDHAGFELKAALVAWLADSGHEPVDCGPTHYDPDDDYPAFCITAAQRTVDDAGSFAVVLGGSGNGEQIAANKVTGARATLCWSAEIAALARQHNNANVLSIPARFMSEEELVVILRTFLETPFSGDARHVRRLAQIAAYESTGVIELPGDPSG